MKLASSMTLSHKDGVTIDGIPFPFYVAEQGATIEPGDRDTLTVVSIPVLVYGVVILEQADTRRVIDQELGDVGQWARDFVRAGLLEAHPWLNLKEADA